MHAIDLVAIRGITVRVRLAFQTRATFSAGAGGVRSNCHMEPRATNTSATSEPRNQHAKWRPGTEQCSAVTPPGQEDGPCNFHLSGDSHKRDHSGRRRLAGAIIIYSGARGNCSPGTCERGSRSPRYLRGNRLTRLDPLGFGVGELSYFNLFQIEFGDLNAPAALVRDRWWQNIGCCGCRINRITHVLPAMGARFVPRFVELHVTDGN